MAHGQDWCRGKMKEMFDSDDITLIKFLMKLRNSNEVVEYIDTYMYGKPGKQAFTTEFLR